jgi:predicted TIM-barrel fold metal-dependent hydrolase
MSRGYQVIDADGHIVEPHDMWDRYLDPKYADRKPAMVKDADGVTRFQLNGQLWPTPCGLGAGRPEGVGAFYDTDSAHRREGGWDSAARLTDMDAEGIDVMVLYPSMLLMGIATIEDAGYAEAVCRAYNDWLADQCRHDPARIIGVALVPLRHPQVAVREARRGVKELGMRGVMAHPAPADERNLDHPDYDPVYAEIEALGVPLAFHEGGGGHERTLSSFRYDSYILTHVISHPFEQMTACANMIVGGVFERFPRLQVAYLEAGSSWLPGWLDRLDEHVERLHHLAPSLTLSPSEYFNRNCWISCDPDERTLAATIGLIGTDRIVWASDYPHLDARDGPVRKFFATQTSLTDADFRAILQDNPRRLYGLPVAG